MKQNQTPLYPKSSPIYNKILQLAIAILLIVFVMNFWLSERNIQQNSIQGYADEIAKLYLEQAASSSLVFIEQRSENLQRYVDDLAKQPFVRSVHLYEKTGEVIAQSEDAESINELYGFSAIKVDNTSQLKPYVQRLQTEKFQGYIRLTLHQNLITSQLLKTIDQQYNHFILFMLVAGVIGFFLTRGLNRFSRQGFRPPQKL